MSAATLPRVSFEIQTREPPSMSTRLVVVDGPDQGRIFYLTQGEPLVLGRSEKQGATAVQGDETISSRHCEIAVDGGNVKVTDLNSKNGTFVNNQKVSAQALNSCDVIGFGATKLLVTLGA